MSFPRKHPKSALIPMIIAQTAAIQANARRNRPAGILSAFDRQQIDAWLEVAQIVVSTQDSPCDVLDLFTAESESLVELSTLRTSLAGE